MRGLLLAMGLLAGLLALAACAAQEEAPFPGRAAAPAPAAPEAILPRKDAWQQEWERVLAAAKQEGKVAVMGPTGSDIRRALTEPFEKKYGISVEFLGLPGAEETARIRAEREAGQYLWDVFIGGATYGFTIFRALGAMEPIEPALILPEVKDPKNWRGERLYFVDKERKVLATTVYASGTWAINPSQVKPGGARAPNG